MCAAKTGATLLAMPCPLPPGEISTAPHTGHLNRMTEIWRFGLHPTGGYMQLNDLVYNVYGDANRPGRLTNSWEYNSHGGRGYRGGYNGAPVQYDAAGDLLRIASETFTYSSEVQRATTISIAGQATTNHYSRAGNKLAYTTPTGQRYAQYEKLEFYQGQAYRYYTDDGYYDFGTGRWVYHIKDYLGTPRVTFSDVNGDDVITPSTEILEERTLYPFGLYAFGRTASGFTGDKRDFTGHEFVGGANQRQQGVIDMLARVYVPGVGVFAAPDPMATSFAASSPYAYALNNPIRFVDPTGMAADDNDFAWANAQGVVVYDDRIHQGPATTIVRANEDGTYHVTRGVDDGSTAIATEEGHLVGQSLTPWSFQNEEGEFVVGAELDIENMDGQAFIDKDIIVDNPGVIAYGVNATNGKRLDFKDRGIVAARAQGITDEQHRYRGGMMRSGAIASARDIGNYAAGLVAARNGLSWSQTRTAFDARETWQSRNWGMLRTGPVSEGVTSKQAQVTGFRIGSLLRISD